jgi:hypothetical protein
MKQDTESVTDPQWIDLSTLESKRRTFRNLLIASMAFSIAAVVARGMSGLPDSVLLALDFEAEMVPQWRMFLAGLIAIAIVAITAWGLYDLWHYRRSGVPKFFGPTLLPLLLLVPGPYVTSRFSEYLYLLGLVACGMLLFMCLTQPDVFEPATAESGGPTTVPPLAANETKAT